MKRNYFKIHKNKSKTYKYNFKLRQKILLYFLFGIFLILICRVGYITLVKGKEYSEMAKAQWNNTFVVSAKRGNILGRNGSILATSLTSYRVEIDSATLRDYCEEKKITLEKVSADLGAILNTSSDSIYATLNSTDESGKLLPFIILARNIEKDFADKISALKYFGIIISKDTKRYYPNNNYLSHVLGVTNLDGEGLTGLELQYNDILSGKDGKSNIILDGYRGNLPFPDKDVVQVEDGKNITLTIDENIQYFAEKAAESTLSEHRAKRVSILITKVKTGEVLAMVNKPDFNPNTPYENYENYSGDTESEQLQSMWKNDIVNSSYEPGSTFKVITLAAALEEGVANENDYFNCPGYVMYGDQRVNCWELGGHGSQHISDILKNSCNVAFMELGRRLGKERLNAYIESYGFGVESGIDLPGETGGIVKATTDIADIDLGTIAFGQTNTLNMVQLLTAVNSVVNNGTMVKPHLVKEISHNDYSGATIVDKIYNAEIVKKNLISPENASIVRSYMERAAIKDGAPNTYVEGFSVGVKSGTAQKVDPETGTYSSTKYIPSMIAFSPVDDPEISVFVLVDEPSTGIYYGSQVASPLMQKILADLLPYTNALRSSFSDTSDINVLIPNILNLSIDEAKKVLDEAKIAYKIDGNDSGFVKSVSPLPGLTFKNTVPLTIETSSIKSNISKVVMPDLIGKRTEDVKNILGFIKLTNCAIATNGTVTEQNIAPGTIIDTSTEIVLKIQ